MDELAAEPSGRDEQQRSNGIQQPDTRDQPYAK